MDYFKEPRNFLEETVDILMKKGKVANDVLYVGIINYTPYVDKRCNWEQFVIFAQCVQYDPRFGTHSIYSDYISINRNLIIVGDNWWLSRILSNGYEYWDFTTIPKISEDVKEITKDELFKMSVHFFSLMPSLSLKEIVNQFKGKVDRLMLGPNPTALGTCHKGQVGDLIQRSWMLGKTDNNVLYIAIVNHKNDVEKKCSWKRLVQLTEVIESNTGPYLAHCAKYPTQLDKGPGSIPFGLVIGGEDWWFSREEQDDNIECWRLNCFPTLLEYVEDMRRDDIFTMCYHSVDLNAEKYEVPVEFYTPGRFTKSAFRTKK